MVLTKDVLPEDVLHQHLLDDSKKVTEDIEVAAQKAVESIDKLNFNDELDLAALFSESNVFVTNINEVVTQLRITLLHVNMEPSNKKALSTITQKVDEIAHSVSSSYSDEPAKLQLALKTNVQSVSVEAANLVQLLETGGLKERRQDYLDVLAKILMVIDRITIRNQLTHLNSEEILKIMADILGKMCDSSNTLTNENEYLLSTITHYMNVVCQTERKFVYHLLQHGKHYDEDISKDFLHTSREMYNLLNRMQEVYDNPHSVDYFTHATNMNVRSGIKIQTNLVAHLNKSDSKDIGSIREAILHMLSLSLSNINQIDTVLKLCNKLN